MPPPATAELVDWTGDDVQGLGLLPVDSGVATVIELFSSSSSMGTFLFLL
jgi:hypothetical protein